MLPALHAHLPLGLLNFEECALSEKKKKKKKDDRPIQSLTIISQQKCNLTSTKNDLSTNSHCPAALITEMCH